MGFLAEAVRGLPGGKEIIWIGFLEGQFKDSIREPFFTESYFAWDRDHFFILYPGICCDDSHLIQEVFKINPDLLLSDAWKFNKDTEEFPFSKKSRYWFDLLYRSDII